RNLGVAPAQGNRGARRRQHTDPLQHRAMTVSPQSRPDVCYHCALPVVTGARFQVHVDGVAHNVCCPACKAVAETIIGNGLGNYYRYRDTPIVTPNGTPEQDSAGASDFSAFDTPEF